MRSGNETTAALFQVAGEGDRLAYGQDFGEDERNQLVEKILARNRTSAIRDVWLAGAPAHPQTWADHPATRDSCRRWTTRTTRNIKNFLE